MIARLDLARDVVGLVLSYYALVGVRAGWHAPRSGKAGAARDAQVAA